ncbi:MAG: hypothetical protein J6S21_02625, partial [Victivallales bacterium]|nr:hypothetical protein [Victivallales bacterium]
LTAGYYEKIFAGLTDADAGRQRSATHNQPEPAEQVPAPQLMITVREDDGGGTCFEMIYGDAADTFRIPPQRIASPRRASQLGELMVDALRAIPRSYAPRVDLPEHIRTKLMPRRCAAVIEESLEHFVRNAGKEDDGTIRIPLPAEITEAMTLQSVPVPPPNRRALGDQPNRIRIPAALIREIVRGRFTIPRGITAVIVEIWSAADLELVKKDARHLTPAGREQIILALPPVIYESQLNEIAAWCREAAARKWLVEVSSWDALQIALECRADFETAGILAVTNPLAAQWLAGLGARCCTVSPEMDQQQLEELSAAANVPLALTVAGRPPLMITRAKLPGEFAPGKDGRSAPFADGRGTNLFSEAAGELTLLRPVVPYDLRRSPNQNIRLANIVIDLCGSENPQNELQTPPKDSRLFKFNYDRDLK